jgi:hypothetical protein
MKNPGGLMAKVDNAAPDVRITPPKRRWQGCGI